MRPAPLLLALSLATTALTVAATEGGRTPRPTVAIEHADGCIATPDEMRRKHMDMLTHQRDKTLREGVRGAQVSLNACISCHANSSNGAVIGTSENFCQSCHSFAAVKLDCFECHQATPAKGTVLGGGVR